MLKGAVQIQSLAGCTEGPHDPAGGEFLGKPKWCNCVNSERSFLADAKVSLSKSFHSLFHFCHAVRQEAENSQADFGSGAGERPGSG